MFFALLTPFLYFRPFMFQECILIVLHRVSTLVERSSVVVECRTLNREGLAAVCGLHQENVKCIPPANPTLYRKAGIDRGIHNFLISNPKHTLLILVRTPLVKFSIFTAEKKISVYFIGVYS